MTKTEEIRKTTYNDLKDKLNQYGKCALVRPTGFGKTGILTKLIKEYKNVVYLYPTEVVVDTVKKFYGAAEIENTRFITYMKLVKLSEDELKEFGDVDLILCDECHRLGGTKTYKAMNLLLKAFPNAHLVGATATPDRMDLIDVVDKFFNNIVVFEYNLHNAFQDGLLKRPYYCFCSYGIEDIESVEKETRLECDKMDVDKDKALTLLRSRLIEISNLQRMDKIIRKTCDAVLADTAYLKFIIFFADFNHIEEKGDEVRKWFQKAYPGYTASVLRITSQNKETLENVHKLDKLVYKNKHIDLIFCVDMLNMGYHVDNLSGIGMYRGTSSGIIFAQQLGRVLSSGSSKPAVVFDFVDNIHRESMYQVLGKMPKKVIINRERREELLEKQKLGTLTKEEEKELNSICNTVSRWWTHANDLQPEDLIATGHEASYRQLIAKTVVEPISMRCRQAWTRWIERGGDASIMTREAILAQQAPTGVPLEAFARLKKVSVEAVLKEMRL